MRVDRTVCALPVRRGQLRRSGCSVSVVAGPRNQTKQGLRRDSPEPLLLSSGTHPARTNGRTNDHTQRHRVAEAFVEWCAAQRIGLGYIQPGKPDQNAFIESFNRTEREEVLDAYLFDSLDQVRAIAEAWLAIYNTERPHDSLGQVPALTFLPTPDAPAESTLTVSP